MLLDKRNSLYRELLLLKVSAGAEERSSIKEVVDIYRAKIVDLTKTGMIIELTGTPEKLNAFMDVIGDYEITEVCRTGVAGIESNFRKGE